MSYFFLYALISVVEFGSWCMYISGDRWFFAFWSRFSTWGSLILYMLPPLFAALQLWLPATSGGLATGTSDGYINAVMLFFWGVANWLFQFIAHLMFADRVTDHVHA